MKDNERVILKLEGVDNSRALTTYVDHGGYQAVKKAFAMKPEAIVAEVKASGLRGRGGAGFPTGLKWGFVPKNDSQKYLICNNDESEPGTFKDRHICTVSPHSIIEGMIIAGYTVGASKGYIYTRWEFQTEIGYLEEAIAEAYEAGWLGKDILGSGFTFDLDHYTGAGAYICGEETGLISSLEGKKGQPKLKPPFPAVSGYLGSPTVVNNTETLANVPHIIINGAAAFRRFGTEKSPGTKLFSISGPLNKPGVYEVPLGYNFEKFINEVAGGMRAGHQLKAVIPGGASAPVLTKAELSGLTMDYEALQGAGSMLGSGAIMVIDEQTSMVDMLKCTVDFFAHESCGQCTPCREGTGWLANIMRGIEQRTEHEDSIDRLHTVASHMGGRTICALSDACAMPVKSYVEKFSPELKAYLAKGAIA